MLSPRTQTARLKPPSNVAALERFTPLSELGQGGMGIVFQARQNCLDREVALKKVRPDVSRSEEDYRLLGQEFMTEALVNGSLQHPNIVPVYDLGTTAKGELYMAMQLVGGRSWETILRDGDKPLDFHIETLIQVCNAVAYAHSHGLVHNDLKPSNVMVGTFGEVLVMDWGLAVEACASADEARIRHKSCIREFCGTPAYAPPELARGLGMQVGPWTDIYLLGGILYRIVAGHPPHGGEDLEAVMLAAARGEITPLRETLPGELKTILQHALAPEPGHRHPSVWEFQDELRSFLKHRESVVIAEAAAEKLEACQFEIRRLDELTEAERNRLYEKFAQAVAGFNQARRLWHANPSALEGERRARLSYAEAALRLRDLGLAEAQAAKLEALELGQDSGTHAIRAAGHSVASQVLKTRQAGPLRKKIKEERTRQEDEVRGQRRTRLHLRILLAVAFCGLLAGLFLLHSKNLEIEAGRQAAEEQAHAALRHGEIAQDALEKLGFEVHDRLLDELGSQRANEVARDILRVALEGWQELKKTSSEQGELSRNTARAHLSLGELTRDLDGDLDGALVELFHAHKILHGLYEAEPDDPQVGRDYARCLSAIAEVHLLRGELEQAAKHYTESRGLFGGLEQAGVDDAALRWESAVALQGIGEVQWARGDAAAAVASYTAALERKRGLLVTEDKPRQREYSSSLKNLGEILEQTGELDRARGVYDEALELDRRLYHADSTSVRAGNDLADALESRARVTRKQGDSRAAFLAYRDALELARRLHEEDPRSIQARRRLATCLRGYAESLLSQGDSGAAIDAMYEAATLTQAWHERDPSNAVAGAALAEVLGELGAWLIDQGELGEGRDLLLQSLRLRRELVSRDPGNVLALGNLARALKKVGDAWLEQGDLEGAETQYREGLEIQRELVARDGESLLSRRNLALLLERLGDLALAESRLADAGALHGEALELQRAISASDATNAQSRRNLFVALHKVAEVYEAEGLWDKARDTYDEAQKILRQLRVRDPDDVGLRRDTSVGLLKLGGVLEKLGDTESAQASYGKLLEIARELVALDTGSVSARRDLSVAAARLGTSRLASDGAEAALPLLEEGVALARGVVARQDTLANRRDLAVQLFQLAQAEVALERLTAAEAHLDDALLWLTDVPVYAAEREILRHFRGEVRFAQLLQGSREPTSPEDFTFLGLEAQQRGATREALGHFRTGFAGGIPDHLRIHLPVAAGVAAAVGGPAAERDALAWLQSWAELLREQARGLDDGGPLEELRGLFHYVRDTDPAFAGLRARGDFLEALGDEP